MRTPKRTHCSRNHPYTRSTMRIEVGGYRGCRWCDSIRARKCKGRMKELFERMKG